MNRGSRRTCWLPRSMQHVQAGPTKTKTLPKATDPLIPHRLVRISSWNGRRPGNSPKGKPPARPRFLREKLVRDTADIRLHLHRKRGAKGWASYPGLKLEP